MRKNVLAMSVATLIGGLGLAGGASAGVWGTPTADTLEINPGGIGHILLVPYYSAANNTMTLVNIVNTDTSNGKAVKVRFRGAGNSDDVFDFQLFLSPGDVYSGAIVARNGLAHLESADNSCTLPYSVRGTGADPQTSTAFVTSRLGPAGNRGTLEGYVEILNMADMPVNSALYTATKHLSNGTVPCTQTVMNNLVNDPMDVPTPANASTVMSYFREPTTGLMANWTVINVENVASWGGSATAVEARIGTGGAPGTGNIVFSPQTAQIATAADILNTSDPLIINGLLPQLGAAKYDFPDLSTPYVTPPYTPGGAEAQADVLTTALAVLSVTNEYITSASVVGGTDWVFSMPTRRYSVAYDYYTDEDDLSDPLVVPTSLRSDRMVFNNTGDLAGVDGGKWFGTNNVRVDDSAARVSMAGAPVICAFVPPSNLAWYNRSELSPSAPTTDFVVSPGNPEIADNVPFCGEVSVLGINSGADTSSDVLGASIGMNRLNLVDAAGNFREGWASISTITATHPLGLPILGAAFTRLRNAGANNQIFGNFGSVFPHRYTKTPLVP